MGTEENESEKEAWCEVRGRKESGEWTRETAGVKRDEVRCGAVERKDRGQRTANRERKWAKRLFTLPLLSSSHCPSLALSLASAECDCSPYEGPRSACKRKMWSANDT